MQTHFYFSASEAAAYLGLTPQSLAVYRCNGIGPEHVKLGNTRRAPIIYRRPDLDSWDKQRRRKKRNASRAGA